jgi:V/A-type H+-transporting ATPase subunit E
MDANAILEKIAQDARDAASSTLEDANKRAGEMKAASEERIGQQKKSALDRAKKDGVLLRERMLRMAELEDKKSLLSAKREVMDKAFMSALGMLETMDAKKMRAFFLRLVSDCAEGDETLLIGAKNNAWFDDAFVAEANAALKARGKKADLQKGVSPVLGVGFALKKGGTQVNCTMDALLSQSRMGLETDVARVLFG